jgi:hypothetical protein
MVPCLPAQGLLLDTIIMQGIQNFSLKPFLKKLVLRRLTTPTTSFSVKPFQKRLVITPLVGIFDQTFFKKVCA